MFSQRPALLAVLAIGAALCVSSGRSDGAAVAASPERQPAVGPRPQPVSTEARKAATSNSAAMSVAELTAKVRESAVVISVTGRDGERAGLGAGFVISKDGLIATNMHVIGEARPISVTNAAGTKYEVSEIYATDRSMDLAVIRVNGGDLRPLELGDSDTLKQGQDVVAIGNPRGFEHSVVAGVLSGRRTIDGKPMLQLAMPIEQGNSGGPLLDSQGRVHGILTMKSVITENLGFAVAINALKPLLKKPNPIPIENWLTIGALNPGEWTQMFGARWRQRAGRILVEGPGAGFGGRTLLVANRSVPAPPFELAVWTRLNREDGAAGLAFHFHNGERHYGFYASNGRMRLTRFDGPDVYSWHVLQEVCTPAYRTGEWNRLKVRVEPGRIVGFVNDVRVAESSDSEFRAGAVALATFRDTRAEFKGFAVGKDLPSILPSPDVAKRVEGLVAGLNVDRPPKQNDVDRLLPVGAPGVLALRRRAELHDREAAQLRRLADALQQRRVQQALIAQFTGKVEKDIDLLRAALLIASADNEDLDVDAYVGEVDRMAASIRSGLPKDGNDEARLKVIDAQLFAKLGYHGSRTDFFNRSNSYMNEVIDDREGLPLTLAILYIELARRQGIAVVGVGLPGRFFARLESVRDNATLIDVFDGARRISRQEAESLVHSLGERTIRPDDWRPKTKREIIQRLLQNLAGAAQESNDAEGMLRYVELLLALDPDSAVDHWHRALLCYQTGRRSESLTETNWLLAKDPEKLSDVADPAQIRQLKALLESLP